MPSLNEILAAHPPLLLLDAASARVQAGLLAGDGGGRWESSEDEAGVGVFRCVEALGVDMGAVGSFAFCSGPGSLLGIRTVAMALRAWRVALPRPVFAYGSLALVAHAVGRPGAGVIADARRGAWHLYQLGRELRRVPTAELPSDLLMPEGFRHWTELPATPVERTPYSIAAMFARPAVAAAELFRPTDAPDAFLPEEPSYATWTPQMHRA
jgi:tRNA threonylcarbamoyladenosine biosynthesis protein TsaB